MTKVEGRTLLMETFTTMIYLDYLPSNGVWGSGLLANTISTYSSCNRSNDAFKPVKYKKNISNSAFIPYETRYKGRI